MVVCVWWGGLGWGSPLKVQLYPLTVLPHTVEPLTQCNVAVRVWGVGHDGLLGVTTSQDDISFKHVTVI